MTESMRVTPTSEAASSGADDSAGARIRVRAVQFAPTADAARNSDAVSAQIAEAAASGIQLVVFPEYSSFFANPVDGRMVAAAQDLDGPFLRDVRAAAARSGVHVVVGLVEAREDGARFSNTLVAVDPSGDIVATYRKQHLYDAFGQRESDWVEPGALDAPQTFGVGPFRVGLQTCYDIRFPEVSRRLIDAGVDVLVVPAEWVPGPGKEDQWMTLLRARAIENTAFVVAADHPRPTGVGLSVLVDPAGVVLAQAGDDAGVTDATLDRPELEAVRGRNPALELRRYRVVPGE
ncbi:carbon-nitrogen hydrolase family protein [Okibacterium fritillariae]|uniref:Predicted amidohydrolase n=1 Tax=Okibacterium fritillariae TaxID=123320 RepID=A0A1T5J2S5_9MICO|nr:carbon-nitrogen hydrolase family protein [Okibacterium fritillariae]SKC45674.1 Predicted amidohydrolase [Okibacterium fritillariae]